ncbi:MAG TPA: hypothetical protein VFV67_01280 [Actinophytocola sp.]|uniref:peptidoglycan-binding domain-containing protein n=1 Tax=Actinophytocola sp. TaxID=1872138 RepID=UPI002DB666E2|nr:hypothetical protein [Actinophytocola sp.]HEU5469256.1 hypothetical protein [Actinophytocola sp.]
MQLKRLGTAAITVAVSVATVLGLSASPAAASGDHSGRAYVHSHDWWLDEGDLSTSRHALSNATCLWQKILWADGKLDNAGIDGIFGPDTANATAAWKRTRNLPDDGKAGINAFRIAGNDIVWSDVLETYIYRGDVRVAWITIDSEGRFGFYDDGVHRLAGYNFRTCT